MLLPIACIAPAARHARHNTQMQPAVTVQPARGACELQAFSRAAPGVEQPDLLFRDAHGLLEIG